MLLTQQISEYLQPEGHLKTLGNPEVSKGQRIGADSKTGEPGICQSAVQMYQVEMQAGVVDVAPGWQTVDSTADF